MNAERLHAIALAVREDLSGTDEVTLIQQLAASVRNQAQNPAETSYATQTNDLRAQLNKRLANAPSNTFSNAWRQTLEELGIADLLGETVRSGSRRSSGDTRSPFPRLRTSWRRSQRTCRSSARVSISSSPR